MFLSLRTSVYKFKNKCFLSFKTSVFKLLFFCPRFFLLLGHLF